MPVVQRSQELTFLYYHYVQKMDNTVSVMSFVLSCILLNQTAVEKLGDTDENSSDHFDFSGVSDTIRD